MEVVGILSMDPLLNSFDEETNSIETTLNEPSPSPSLIPRLVLVMNYKKL